jgi:hypothetical protein
MLLRLHVVENEPTRTPRIPLLHSVLRLEPLYTTALHSLL